MGYDPEGTLNWRNFFKSVGVTILAVAVVASVTAAVVLTAGAAAVALGAGLGTVLTITSSAAVGGLVMGGISIVGQGISKGFDNINIGTAAIDAFIGSAYGAISGITGPGTGLATKIGVGFGKVSLSGISTILHSLNLGDSSKMWSDVANNMLTSAALQTLFIGAGSIKFGGGTSSQWVTKISNNKYIAQISNLIKTTSNFIIDRQYLQTGLVTGFKGISAWISGRYS